MKLGIFCIKSLYVVNLRIILSYKRIKAIYKLFVYVPYQIAYNLGLAYTYVYQIQRNVTN